MRKIILSLAAVAMVVTGASAIDIAKAPGKYAANNDKKAVGSVKLNNVKINNKSNIKNSAVAGNTGVKVKGKHVNMKNVKINNKSNIKNSAVIGNTGVLIKAKNVNAKNVKINSKSNIKNSAVAGNTGVSLGN